MNNKITVKDFNNSFYTFLNCVSLKRVLYVTWILFSFQIMANAHSGSINDSKEEVILATITSAQSGNWNDTATWVGGVVPDNTSDVIIDTSHEVTLNIGFVDVLSLTINTGGTLTRFNGATFNISGGIVNNGTLTLEGLGAQTINMNSNITNNAIIDFKVRTLASTGATFTNNGTLNIENTQTWNSIDIENETSGIINVINDSLNFGANLINNTGGTVNIQTGNVFSLTGNLTNSGSFDVSGALNFVNTTITLNTGQVLDGSGSMRFFGTCSIQATAPVTLGIATILVGGTDTLTGTAPEIIIDAGTTFNTQQAANLNGITQITNNGTFNIGVNAVINNVVVDVDIVNNANASFLGNNGTNSLGTGSLTNNGTFFINVANFSLDLINNSSGIIDLTRTSVTILDSALQNDGAVVISGPGGQFNFTNSVTGSGSFDGNFRFENASSISPAGTSAYGCMSFSNSTQDVIILGTYSAEINGPVACSLNDQISFEGVVGIGGCTLDVNIDFTPNVGDFATILTATEINGTFEAINGLPADVALRYNFPEEGMVSIEFGSEDSLGSGNFSDPSIWASGVVPTADTPAIINGGHTVTLDVPSLDVGRLQVTETATLVVPSMTQVNISGSTSPAVINNGTLDIDGTLNIDGSQSVAIANEGTISLDGTVGSNGLIEITNTTATAIANNGFFTIGDNATVNIDGANIGIENTNDLVINQDGLLEIDFTIESGIITSEGSTMTNAGESYIGMDVSATNSVGFYGIDHSGYLLNTETGIIEISGATESQMLLPFFDPTTRSNPQNGTVENNGQTSLNGGQTSSINQGDSPSTVQGKFKHKLRKRPPPNPGRDVDRNNGVSSFINQVLSVLNGNGIVESDITFLDGGTISPGLFDGDEGIIVFDGDQSFENVTLKIDINGKTLKGTDYDLIALVGTTTLGGNLDLDITYVPEVGDIISFIESDNVIGTFVNPVLPPDWVLKYNFPSQGDVSLEFEGALSVDEAGLEDIVVYYQSGSDSVVVSGSLESESRIQLFDSTGRLILKKDLDTLSATNSISVSDLASGTYIVKLISNSNNIKTEKIIIN